MDGILNITKKQISETGIVFAIISIFSNIFWHFNLGLWIGIGLLLVTLLMPVLIYPLAFFWFGLSHILGLVSTRLILCVLFLLFVTPVGLMRRLFKKDSLQLRMYKKVGGSAFKERNHSFCASDLKYPF